MVKVKCECCRKELEEDIPEKYRYDLHYCPECKENKPPTECMVEKNIKLTDYPEIHNNLMNLVISLDTLSGEEFSDVVLLLLDVLWSSHSQVRPVVKKNQPRSNDNGATQ